MNKPCKYCDKSIYKNAGEFEQECNGTCEQYNNHIDSISKGLDDLLTRGNAILKNHGKEQI